MSSSMSNGKTSMKHTALDHTQVVVINPKTDELVQRDALHPDVCQQRLSGTLYQRITLTSDGDCDVFLDILQEISSNLQWLLCLKYQTFWCQVLHDDNVHSLLDSYLRHAPRYAQNAWPEKLKQEHNQVHRLVFMAFLRMSTLKESPEHFMSKKLFAEIIYNNYLFDIPRLMDLCCLYGVSENIPLLKKMLENIFLSQPRYYDDLQHAAKTVHQILGQIEDKCLASGNKSTPAKLSSGPIKSPLLMMSEKAVGDIVLYIHDTMHTLKSFIVDVFPEAGKAFYEHGVVEKLATVYSEVIPSVRSALREKSLDDKLYLELRNHVRQSRDKLLIVANAIMRTNAYDHVIKAYEAKDPEEIEDSAEEYFRVLSSLSTEKLFFDELNKRFNLLQSVERVVQICPDVASVHVELLATVGASAASPSDFASSVSKNFTKESEEAGPSTSKAALTCNPSVLSVLEFLPDLRIDFVEACLKYYDDNAQTLIGALLDGNLPPHLDEMQRSTKGAICNEDNSVSSRPFPGDDTPSSSKSQDYLSDRKNVYDNDQFDVFRNANEIDRSKVYYGKAEKSDVCHWSTENNVDVEKLRNLYSRYGLGADVADNEDFLLRDNPTSNYEDEYDDTYDDAPVKANDADSADELLDGKDVDEDTDEESSEEERPQNSFRNRRHFVENPETIRVREEARRKQREEDASRGGRAKRGHKIPPGHRSGNVQPEGMQKQKDIERRRKDYKASRGSHNRKMLATKKANKGMFMGS